MRRSSSRSQVVKPGADSMHAAIMNQLPSVINRTSGKFLSCQAFCMFLYISDVRDYSLLRET